MIEVVGTFDGAFGERYGAFAHAVVPCNDGQTAKMLASAKLRDCGFTILSDGEEVVDITGWVELDESIQAAVERMTETGDVEFGDFESFPLDDLEGDVKNV